MLKHIKGDSYFFDSKICIGIHIKEGKATLIDTGIDDDYARKVFNALKEKDIVIERIINTHSHGDHFGGNNLIKERSGCKVYAPEFESIIMENPSLEPIYLYGADPIAELKDKFFMARPCKPDVVISGDHIGVLRIIPLPGHSFNLIGVLSPDKVLFASDAFFTEEVLEKYKIPYVYDVDKTLSSLHYLLDLDFDACVLAHGGLLGREKAMDSIRSNIQRIEQVCEDIRTFLKEKNTIEGVLSHLARRYDLFVSVGQYFLNLSIVKSYLAYLRKKKLIDCRIEDKELVWETFI